MMWGEDDKDTSADPRIGLVIAGKYRIESVLGRGGMGAVYRGTHVELGEPVALKFLHGMFASTPELRARFRREAIALARLRHPSIVSLLDFGEHGEELYMVMELVVGKSLATLLEETSLSLPFIARLFDALLDVLETAHEAGVVHRDLKPSNVMVVTSTSRTVPNAPPSLDHVKLLDFGLVHLPGMSLEKLTQTGVVHGTPDYMSPEQCQGEEVGPKSDIYSLGVMLYECLAGKTPFDGKGAAQLMAQHMFVEPPRLPSLGDESSDPSASTRRIALGDLVRRALAKNADRRPGASEMRVLLAGIMSGTDPLSIADHASRERARDAALSRGERALTGRPPPAAAPPNAASARARARVSIEDAVRASSIRSALSVLGIDVAEAGDPTPDVFILSAREAYEETARAMLERDPKAAFVVIDVDGPDAMRAAVRSGARDMLLVDSPDSELGGRVLRIMRRGR